MPSYTLPSCTNHTESSPVCFSTSSIVNVRPLVLAAACVCAARLGEREAEEGADVHTLVVYDGQGGATTDQLPLP